MAAGYALFDTEIGRCGIAWSERGIRALQLPEVDDEKTRARLLRRFPDLPETCRRPPSSKSLSRSSRFCAARRSTFRPSVVDLDDAPAFNRQVYEIARTIPAGETMTYGEIARHLGDLQLSRAVGQALGQNPVAIIVPCHRVLGADRKPGGFSAGGGVQTKLKILSIERAHIGGTRDLFDLV
jgi:methylated-DNA-[protein]-cysteine S-methyltransferase